MNLYTKRFFSPIKATLFFVYFILFSFILRSQGHNHGNDNKQANTPVIGNTHKKGHPPHGGQLIDVGKYDLEVVFNITAEEEKFSVYILNSKAKVLDIEEASGKITLRYKDGREIIKELKKSEKVKLYCNFEDIVNEFVVIIDIIYKGKKYSTVCEYAGLGEYLKK